MDNLSVSFSPNSLIEKATVKQILLTNEVSQQYVLSLSEADAKQLVETKNYCLKTLGRIEVGGEIINDIILAFCDSPFLWQGNYAETLNQLVAIFYIYKEETLEQINDAELIDIMKDYYDNRCMGSVELLVGRELERLAHNIRYGLPRDDDTYEAPPQRDYGDGEEYDQ